MLEPGVSEWEALEDGEVVSLYASLVRFPGFQLVKDDAAAREPASADGSEHVGGVDGATAGVGVGVAADGDEAAGGGGGGGAGEQGVSRATFETKTAKLRALCTETLDEHMQASWGACQRCKI